MKQHIGIPTEKSTIGKGDHQEVIISCMPFTHGRYNGLIFEGTENIHKRKLVYVFYHNKYGEFVFDKESLELLLQTRKIPDLLLIRIKQCLQAWKKNFG